MCGFPAASRFARSAPKTADITWFLSGPHTPVTTAGITSIRWQERSSRKALHLFAFSAGHGLLIASNTALEPISTMTPVERGKLTKDQIRSEKANIRKQLEA